ncbi:RNA-guided endonuclease TnpB family protein [Lentzea sp. NPDC003310]|uniref:RNA-guided endonuclease InsQ/TnpB family protein n=1 Tax=Lentzea sp. NPDC003310 TaxID=3154447 RepID=UPI0033A59731
MEIIRTEPTPRRPGDAVGVDLGVKSLAVLSTGLVVPNPRHLGLALRALRRLQRQAARRTGPDKRTGQQPSSRWRRTRDKITRLHARTAYARSDGLHELTTGLIREFGTIVLEDLPVSGMLRNRRLARHIADVGMRELRRQLGYKSARGGSRLVIADRWYPSSKTCSDCGAVKAKLPLRVRVYDCDECGSVLDRDLNAARNLVSLVGEAANGTSAASCAGTGKSPTETHVRPTRCGQRVLPREDPAAAGPTPHREVTATERSGQAFAHGSGNGRWKLVEMDAAGN